MILIFFTFLKIFLINIVTILIMSEKMVTRGLLKIKVFWSKGCDVIIPAHDVTSKILSHDSNYIVDLVNWPKFVNSNIFMRKVIITEFYKDLIRKYIFNEGWSWFQFNNLGLALAMALKFYTSVVKGLKLKLKVLGDWFLRL